MYSERATLYLNYSTDIYTQIDKHEGDTPSLLRTAYHPIFGLAYCVPPCFGLAYCVLLNNIFGVSIYIKKYNDNMSHACVQLLLQTLALVCLLVRFPSFRPPKINVEIYKCRNDQKKRERSERANKNRVFFLLCMSRLLCFLMKIGPFKSIKFDVCV